MIKPEPSDSPITAKVERLKKLDERIKFILPILFIVFLFIPTGVLFWEKFSWDSGDWFISILSFPFLLMAPLIFGALLGKLFYGLIHFAMFKIIFKNRGIYPSTDINGERSSARPEESHHKRGEQKDSID